ncbi:MAG: (d)CMP kinase [Fusobacteriaceae bacterium]
MTLKKTMTIAIDGPAGSGKSTIAKMLASKYGMTYLDTGAMYRMVTYYFLENKLNIKEKNNILNILDNINVDIVGDKFFVNEKDVTKEIRTPKVTEFVSEVAAIKEVREKLVELQREISKGKKTILDGRDIGTVVFPKADLKIFLVASPEERAKRRVEDYKNKGIQSENFQDVLAAIIKRDFLDSTREESPLKKASDAVEIDSSKMDAKEVCEIISKYIDVIEG